MLKRRGLDLRGSTGRVEGSSGKLECVGDCGACPCSGWTTGGGTDRAEEQKVKLGHLNLYLKVHPIHSKSEARGRLGLESYLCVREVTFLFTSEKCCVQTELQEHCVWRKMPLKGGLDPSPALPPRKLQPPCKRCLSCC